MQIRPSSAPASRDLSATNGGTKDIAQASAAVSSLEAIVREHREEAAAQEAAAERASSQLAALQEEHNMRCTNWMAEKDELNGQMSSLRSDVSAREEDLGRLRAAQSAQADRARQLEGDLASAQADLAAANADRDKLNGLIGSLQAKVAALQRDLGDLRAAKQERAQAAQKAQRQLETDLAAARAERDSLTGRVSELERKLAEGAPSQTGTAVASAASASDERVATREVQSGSGSHAGPGEVMAAGTAPADLVAAKEAAEKAEGRVRHLQAQLEAAQEAAAVGARKLQEATAEARRLEAELAAARSAGAGGAVAAAAAAAATPAKKERRGLFGRRSSFRAASSQLEEAASARPASAGSVSLPESAERAALAEEIATFNAEKSR